MTQMPVPDDRFMSGVYYDASVGEFFRFERDDDSDEVRFINAFDDEEQERLSFEEFVDLQPDLFPVEEDAIENPVSYFEQWVSYESSRSEFDPSFLFSDMATEVVEVDDE